MCLPGKEKEPVLEINLDSSHVYTSTAHSSHTLDAPASLYVRLYNNKPGANYECSPPRMSLTPPSVTHFATYTRRIKAHGAINIFFRAAFHRFFSLLVLFAPLSQSDNDIRVEMRYAIKTYWL